jgi:hypothetical protein
MLSPVGFGNSSAQAGSGSRIKPASRNRCMVSSVDAGSKKS